MSHETKTILVSLVLVIVLVFLLIALANVPTLDKGAVVSWVVEIQKGNRK